MLRSVGSEHLPQLINIVIVFRPFGVRFAHKTMSFQGLVLNRVVYKCSRKCVERLPNSVTRRVVATCSLGPASDQGLYGTGPGLLILRRCQSLRQHFPLPSSDGVSRRQ